MTDLELTREQRELDRLRSLATLYEQMELRYALIGNARLVRFYGKKTAGLQPRIAMQVTRVGTLKERQLTTTE